MVISNYTTAVILGQFGIVKPMVQGRISDAQKLDHAVYRLPFDVTNDGMMQFSHVEVSLSQ